MAEHEITAFERRARLAAPYFNRTIRRGNDVLPPPFTVEFLGTPSGGKSTLIRELDKFWKRQNFRVWHPQEGAEAVRYLDRTTPFYNIATGLYAFQLLMQVSEGHQYDHVLFERCVFDTYTWMKFWQKKEQLTQEMMQMIQGAFLAGAPRVDAAFMLICDPDVAIARETKNELSRQVGGYTNPAMIEFLIECNKESYKELHTKYPQLNLIDVSAMNEKQVIHMVAEKILDMLEEKILRTAS